MVEALRMLKRMADAMPSHSGSYYVSHLNEGDQIPQFGHGLPDHLLIDRKWIWIAYQGDQSVALLAAVPCHNISLITRIYAIKEAPRAVLVGLLRKALADMLNRGYTRYAAYLDADGPEDGIAAKLLRVIKKAKGEQVGGKHIFVAGPTDLEGL
jgi:hypothetical protein